MREDKLFLWKLLAAQTAFYTLFYIMVYYQDSVRPDREFLWLPFMVTYYSVSVVLTFIIPMRRVINGDDMV